MGTPSHSSIPSAARIALIYALVAGLWILCSDKVLQFVVGDATIQRLTYLQTLKGLFFVVTTAILLFILVYRALAALHQSQIAMQTSEDRFRRLVEGSPYGIFIHVNGEFRYVNPAFIAMLGYSHADQLLSRSNFELLHPDDHEAVRQRQKILREARTPVPLLEQRMKRIDGTYIWVEAAGEPFDLDGQPGAQVTVRDITARKEAQEALRLLNETLEQRVADRTNELKLANEDLKTFSYMISHDLRLPLQGLIRSAGELVTLLDAYPDAPSKELREGPSMDPGAALSTEPCAPAAARKIVAMAARLDRLIDELFEYNRLARGQVEPQRISATLVVHEVIGQLQLEPDMSRAQFNVVEPLPWVLVHRATFALVMRNLIHNGVKYVAPGTNPMVTIYSEIHDGKARLLVEDNGIGLPAEQVTSINQPINDTPDASPQAQSLGMGLAIVHRGVTRMAGTLGVQSSPTGTRFWIDLPRDPQSPS